MDNICILNKRHEVRFQFRKIMFHLLNLYVKNNKINLKKIVIISFLVFFAAGRRF